MAEGRMLKKQISDSKKLGKLTSDSARLLYTWLIPWLDIEDRCTADPDLLKGRLFPKCKSWNARKIDRHLLDLDNAKLIILYDSNGERYLQFTKTLQKKYPEREAPSTIPPPPQEAHADSCGYKRTHHNIKEKKGKEIKLKENVKQILQYLNEKTKRNFTVDSQGFISGRLNDGHTVDDLKKVIDIKIAEWLDDPKMSKYLRPSTLFRKSNFEEYINEEMPIRKVEPGESTYTPTKKDEAYKKACQAKQRELEKKYEPDIREARKAGDQARFEDIENQIKHELAEFSREYHGEEK